MPRTAKKTPLGEWLNTKMKERGFATVKPFLDAVGIQWPSFAKWQSPRWAAVPETRQVRKIVDVLRLNRDDRADLDALIEQQIKLQERAIAARENPAEQGREQAMKLLVDAMRTARLKHDEPPTVEAWLGVAARLAAELQGQAGSEEVAPTFDAPPLLEAREVQQLSRFNKKKPKKEDPS